MSIHNKRKKVWIIHHYATPPNMTGLTRPYYFGLHLKKYGVSTTVFSASYLHYSGTNLIEGNQLYITDNDSEIPFVFVNTPPAKNNGLKRVINMIAFYKNMLRTARELSKNQNKPDIIIASSPHPLAMVAGIKIAKKFKIPCICEVRDFWPEVFFMAGKIREQSLIGKLLLLGEKWIYKNADALVFLKEGDVSYITEKKWDVASGGGIDIRKCHYLNNGVDLEKYNFYLREEELNDDDLNNGKFNVIYTGAIRPVNNVGNILDAAKLLKKYQDIQFLIFGDGSELEFLKKRVVDENLTNVKMKGYVEKKYIPYVLSKSSVNILNYSQSKYNWSRGNSSNKLFEYMASGKPIISTVKMGFSPIEKYRCGISLEEDSPECLANAIMKIYNLPNETYNEFCKNGKKGAINFDYKTLTKRLYEIIQQLT